LDRGFKGTDDATDEPAAYSPPDQQNEEEAWYRPEDWGDVDPDALEDDPSKDEHFLAVPDEYSEKPLHEQMAFLAGQLRARPEADTEEDSDDGSHETEKDSEDERSSNKVPLKSLLVKPLVSSLLSCALSAYVYTMRPPFATAATASIGAAVLALYSGFGFLKFIVRALTMTRVGLA
jgi:hypothetical protein